MRTALPVANYGRTHQINLIPPPPFSTPEAVNSGWSTCSSHCGGGGGGGSGVEKSKGGGRWLAGGICVCLCVCSGGGSLGF